MEATSRPAFIVGCHRSGTTLLRYILDSHPELACPPESKFLLNLHRLTVDTQCRGGLRSLGVGQPMLYSLLRDFAVQVFNIYCVSQGKKRWIDKTPNYFKILEFINEVFGKQAQFVFTIRHPFDNAVSLGEYFRNAGENHEDSQIRQAVRAYGNSRRGWVKYWREVNEEIISFHDSHPEQSFLLHYEALVADAETEISELLDFLEVTRTSGDSHRMCLDAFNITHFQGYQDVKIASTNCIHDRSVGRWERWDQNTRIELWSLVESLAESVGYRTEGLKHKRSGNAL